MLVDVNTKTLINTPWKAFSVPCFVLLDLNRVKRLSDLKKKTCLNSSRGGWVQLLKAGIPKVVRRYPFTIKLTRPTGDTKIDRLPLSIKHKVNAHLREKKLIKSILAIYKWIIETASFDISVSKKYRWTYKNGQNLGFIKGKQSIGFLAISYILGAK